MGCAIGKTASAEMALCTSVVSYCEPAHEIAKLLSTLTLALEEALTLFPSLVTSVLIVDNRPETHTISINELDFDQTRLSNVAGTVRVIHGHGNIGYGSAQNLAFKACESRYHLFLNPDVEIDRKAILVGLQYLQENQDVGLVSPNARNRNVGKIYLCKRHPSVLDFLLRGFAPSWLGRKFANRNSYYQMADLNESEPTKSITIASGCFMLCDSKTISQISGFDPVFFLYFKDFDLSIRLRSHKKIAYLPSMSIIHSGGNTARKGMRHIFFFIVSCIKYFNKHGWRWF